MQLRLQTLFIALLMSAIATACTVAWLRRPVKARTKAGQEISFEGQHAVLHCVMIADAKNLRRLLLIDSYDLNRIGAGGGNLTLLQRAVTRSNAEETVRVLLENGADPNLNADGTHSPLDMASEALNAKVVAILRDAGAE
jgi:hypothetical protein